MGRGTLQVFQGGSLRHKVTALGYQDFMLLQYKIVRGKINRIAVAAVAEG